jgi:hypothetical protein
MTTKSSVIKKLRMLDKVLAEKAQQKDLKGFVVRSKEQELNIRGEFNSNDDSLVLIRCYSDECN